MEILKNLDLGLVNELAVLLARKAKNRKLVIGLTGTLGSGKTTFTKMLLKELGIQRASSPSFVIAHQYHQDSREIYHLDFYRLNQTKQLSSLGINEMLQGKNIVIFEWVDKFPQIQKLCDLVINFRVKPLNKRDVSIKII